MSTALTLYGLETATATLATACKLVTVTGGVSANLTTKVGTIQGSGELFSLGSTATFPGTAVSGSAGVHGYLWDVSTLESNTILPGTWTVKLNLNWNATYTTMTSTITARVWKRSSGGTFTKIGSDMTVAGPGASTTAQTLFTLTGSNFPIMAFATGDKLYLDVWLTVTSTGGATTRTIALWSSSSSTSGIAGQVEIDTPGYGTATTATKSTGVRALIRTQGQGWNQVGTDTFAGRTVSSGFGTASDGTVWSGDTASSSVGSGEGSLQTASPSLFPSQTFGATTYTDVQVQLRVKLGDTGNIFDVHLRDQGSGNRYKFQFGNGNSYLIAETAFSGPVLTSVATTLTAGTFYQLKFRVAGTQLYAKYWADGTAEPTWQLLASSTTYTTAGNVTLTGELFATTAIQVDSFSVSTPTNGTTTGLRAPIRTQITRSVSLRALIRTQKTVSTVVRTLVRTQKTVSTVVRTLVQTLKAVSTPLRARVRTQHSLSTSIRAVVKGITKVASIRTNVRTLATQSVPMRVRARTQHTLSTVLRVVTTAGQLVTKSVVLRVLARTQQTRSTAVRTLVRTLQSVSVPLRTLVRTLQSRSAPLRTVVRTQINKSTTLRTIVRGITKTVNLRANVRIQITKSVVLRTRVRTLNTQIASIRTRIRTQISQSLALRAIVRGITKITSLRVPVRMLKTLTTTLRTVIRTQATKSTPLRTVARTLRTQSTNLRTVIRSQITKSATLRTVARTQKTVSFGLRAIVSTVGTLVTRSTALRLVIRTRKSVTSTLRMLVKTQASKNTVFRTLIRTGNTLNTVIRALVRSQVNKSMPIRTRVRSLMTKSTSIRTAIRTQHILSSKLRALIRSQVTKTTALRTIIRTQHSITMPLRTFIRSQSIQITALRAVIQGITQITQICIHLRTGKTSTTILRILVKNPFVYKLIRLRMHVRSQHVAYFALRVMVLPEAPSAITRLKNRDGHAFLINHDGYTILKDRGE